MEKRKNQFNFVLLLALFFVFFTLVFVGVKKLRVNEYGGGAVQNTSGLGVQEAKFVETFGFSDSSPSNSNDPVLGSVSMWSRGSETLEINDHQVIYRSVVQMGEKITDTKSLQDKAQAFLDEKGLGGNVVLSHDKNKLYKSEGVELEEVENIKDADVLEVMFSDAESGEDAIRVKVAGSAQVLEVLIIRN